MRNPSFTDFFADPLIPLEAVEPFGASLARPECVVSGQSGNIYVSNWNGGVTILCADGRSHDIIARSSEVDLKPNGIAPLPGGAFLIANLADDGGVWRLSKEAQLSPVLTELDGDPVPPANFVLADGPGSYWVTISTTMRPRAKAYRKDVQDGMIIKVVDGHATVAADCLGYTNECQIHPSGEWLYVNETFARRLSRFRIIDLHRLGPRETVYEFRAGVYPDGLCFDVEGGIWITSIVSNLVLRLSPDGTLDVMVADCDIEHIAWVEHAFQTDALARMHLDQIGGCMLRNTSSLAFAGTDMKTAYLGCLLDDKVYRFQSPIAGARPQHWSWS